MFCLCCKDQSQNSFKEKFKNLSRNESICLTLYLILVFSYSTIIAFITYQGYQIQPILSDEYRGIILNWNMDVINQINIIDSNEACVDDFKNAFEQEWYGNSDLKWVSFKVCTTRVEGYSFKKKYLVTPKCSLSTETICGGNYIDNKFCVPDVQHCPLNFINLTESNSSNSSNLEGVNIYQQLAINNSFQYFNISSYANRMPINDIRLSYGDYVCQNKQQIINYPDSSFYNNRNNLCGKNDLSYEKIAEIDVGTFLQANEIKEQNVQEFSNTGRKVGIFVGYYFDWQLNCRDSLLERIIEGEYFWKKLNNTIYIQTFISISYFAFVGIILNALSIALNCRCHLTVLQIDQARNEKLIMKKLTLFLRASCFIIFSIMHILAYFFAAQMHNTLSRSINEQCSSSQVVLQILDQSLEQVVIWRQFMISNFSIFLSALILETYATFSLILNSVQNKKKIFRQSNHNNFFNKQIEQEEIELDAAYQQVVTQPAIPQDNRTNRYMRPSFTQADQKFIRKSIRDKEVQIHGQEKQQIKPSHQLNQVNQENFVEIHKSPLFIQNHKDLFKSIQTNANLNKQPHVNDVCSESEFKA